MCLVAVLRPSRILVVLSSHTSSWGPYEPQCLVVAAPSNGMVAIPGEVHCARRVLLLLLSTLLKACSSRSHINACSVCTRCVGSFFLNRSAGHGGEQQACSSSGNGTAAKCAKALSAVSVPLVMIIPAVSKSLDRKVAHSTQISSVVGQAFLPYM